MITDPIHHHSDYSDCIKRLVCNVTCQDHCGTAAARPVWSSAHGWQRTSSPPVANQEWQSRTPGVKRSWSEWKLVSNCALFALHVHHMCNISQQSAVLIKTNIVWIIAAIDLGSSSVAFSLTKCHKLIWSEKWGIVVMRLALSQRAVQLLLFFGAPLILLLVCMWGNRKVDSVMMCRLCKIDQSSEIYFPALSGSTAVTMWRNKSIAFHVTNVLDPQINSTASGSRKNINSSDPKHLGYWRAGPVCRKASSRTWLSSIAQLVDVQIETQTGH